MKSRIFVAALALVGLGILDAQNANARDYTWTGRDPNGLCPVPGATNWNCGENWVYNDSGAIPVIGNWPGSAATNDTALVGRDISIAGGRLAAIGNPVLSVSIFPGNELDSLTIREQMTVTTGNFVLRIAGASGLEIAAGGTLDISGATGSVVLSGLGEHLIDGELILRTYVEPNASTLQIEETLDLGGSGAIIGQDDDALIQIAGPGEGFTRTLTLRPELKIEGTLTIRGAPGDGTEKFVNDGLVYANRVAPPLIITFANVTVEGRGEFRIGDNAFLAAVNDEINFTNTVVATQLAAYFTLLGPTDDDPAFAGSILDLDTPFATSGHLHMVGGRIECDGGETCVFGSH